MSRILITGGTGFVGGRLARKLAPGNEVLISSRKILSDEILHKHGVSESVLHQSLLKHESFPEDIDLVIHLAALNEWDCIRNPSEAIRVNIDETRIILENAIAGGVRQFVYFSTAHIYGELKNSVTEETLPFPVHPYSITHKAAEDYVISACLKERLATVVIRLSNSFGAPVLPTVNRWTLLANDLARQAIETGKLKLHSNGCQFRDFVCLEDVEIVIAQMISKGINYLKFPIYNLGSGKAIRVIDMAMVINKRYKYLFGKELELQLPEGALPTIEPQLNFSINRLKNEGFIINNNISDEIDRLLNFCHLHFIDRD